MSESIIVSRPVGAVGVILETSNAVLHGAISPEQSASILNVARLVGGTIDPKAVDVLETLAKQLTAVSATLKATAEHEALPVIQLAGFAAQQGKVDRALSHTVYAAVNRQIPMAFTTAASVIASRTNDAGALEAVVAIHSAYLAPDRAEAHFVVTVPASGLATASKVRLG